MFVREKARLCFIFIPWLLTTYDVRGSTANMQWIVKLKSVNGLLQRVKKKPTCKDSDKQTNKNLFFYDAMNHQHYFFFSRCKKNPKVVHIGRLVSYPTGRPTERILRILAPSLGMISKRLFLNGQIPYRFSVRN